jgi:hypothetical protein
MPVGCRGTQIWIAGCLMIAQHVAAPLCTRWSGSCLVANEAEWLPCCATAKYTLLEADGVALLAPSASGGGIRAGRMWGPAWSLCWCSRSPTWSHCPGGVAQTCCVALLVQRTWTSCRDVVGGVADTWENERMGIGNDLTYITLYCMTYSWDACQCWNSKIIKFLFANRVN